MIDRKKLLEMMDGDEEIVQKFLDQFKILASDQLQQLQLHLRNEDVELLSNTVHILKTQSGYLGLNEISELAQTIESELDSGTAVSGIAPQVTILYSKLLDVINNEL